MSHSKYVIVDTHGIEVPILFSPLLSHTDVIGAGHRVVSAGFCQQNADGSFSTYGKSVMLGVVSRPKDAEIIRDNLDADI